MVAYNGYIDRERIMQNQLALTTPVKMKDGKSGFVSGRYYGIDRYDITCPTEKSHDTGNILVLAMIARSEFKVVGEPIPYDKIIQLSSYHSHREEPIDLPNQG